MKKEIQDNVLKQLLLNETATRKDLVKQFEIRAATLYSVIDKLTELGVLYEPDRVGKKPGRRASTLHFYGEHAYFAGVELAPNKLLGTIIDLSGKVIATFKEPFNPNGEKEELLTSVLNFHKKLLSQVENQERVKGIGFADPGLVDIKKQCSILAVNIRNWKKINIQEILKESVGIPNVLIESAVNARTFMEYSETPAPHPDSFFHLELSYGVGGGFIQNGELFHGGMNSGMEIGHLIVEPGGPLCQCGNKGCLEAVVSTAAIQRKVDYFNAHGVYSELSNNEFSMDHFLKAVQKSDKGALSIANEICSSIAAALQAVVALINPKAITISGELTVGMGEMLQSTIKRYLELNCQPTAIAGLQIKISPLDEFGTSRGAALLARKEYLLKHI